MGYEEEIFYSEGDETLEQVAQKGAPSLGTSKARLGWTLSNQISLKMSLLTAGGLGYMAFKGPFQPKLFYDSLFCIFFFVFYQSVYC